MLHIWSAPQPFFLQHEQHVPLKLAAHKGDETGRHVRIGVDARPRRQPLDVRAQFRGERSHQW